VGAACCLERSTAASALGKKDARWGLTGSIELDVGPRENDEPHHLKQQDLDEDVVESKETAIRGWYSVTSQVPCNLFWVAIDLSGLRSV
jgi:hypothetical protein